ncbi:uncharacterized protein N7483_002221 [Penicillium malachiteum]|uniref:uncharacterized protein n=1 Tax=Penicillium malachiteum TaxID=1324776 RepID=UPI002547A8D8|nr:uncharacterized protein N7483_002221 [Penicillium malachiteum]KAJ5737096.1 hypothetical protein N7483_002221 [Penicillium malachiteum]
MNLLNRHFGVAIFAFLLSLLFTNGSWARIHPSNKEKQLSHVSGLDSTQPHALAKRAITEAAYDEYQNRGIQLSCVCSVSDTTAYDLFFKPIDSDATGSLAAEYTTVIELIVAGWEINTTPIDTLAGNLPNYLGSEVLTMTGLNLANNVVIDWQWVVEGENGIDTTSNYQCWFNVAAGAIFVDLAWGPAFKKAEAGDNWPDDVALPAISQLSDVMWIEWADQAGDSAANLKYVFQMDIVNFDTRGVINTAMGSTTWTEFREFTQDDTRFYALLEAPNGVAQSWILANHQATLGIKTVSKIRVRLSSTFQENQSVPNDEVGVLVVTTNAQGEEEVANGGNNSLCWVEGEFIVTDDDSDDAVDAMDTSD